MTEEDRALYLRFHGRILEHFGIQTYQSPVAAIAELVANCWDADASEVRIVLPANLGDNATIEILDDGIGMTFDECQERYLSVGLNRRANDPDERSPEKRRPILGRKGIGKFAGFGIAETMRISTTSKQTGEATVFELRLPDLISDEYVSTNDKPVDIVEHRSPDDQRKLEHGTVVTLSGLKLGKTPSPDAFAKSMARRFLLLQQQADFRVLVNDQELPKSFDLQDVQYVFPRDYKSEEMPADLETQDIELYGVEKLSNDRKIRWQFCFHNDTIDDEELQGIAIFAKGKLIQAPFLFNLSGGLGGQHGVAYLSGQVQADYLDSLSVDLAATERQRVNWEHRESAPLLEWGQTRIKELLRTWQDRRGEQRTRMLDQRVSGFSSRLGRLHSPEQRTVSKALRKLAQVSTLNDAQFEDLGNAVLTAWEEGRLRGLIDQIAQAQTMSEEDLLSVLLEAQALTALNVAEAVRTKLQTVAGLIQRIERRELETAVRDYIAKNPWLIAPQWETFRKETTVKHLLDQAAGQVGFTDNEFNGRVDLALASGNHLLVLEFMRPSLTLNWDHLQRFERYVLNIRGNIDANTAGVFRRVTGYVIADNLEARSDNRAKITSMVKEDMYALDWRSLFSQALAKWQEFLDILVSRAPEDERLQALLQPPD